MKTQEWINEQKIQAVQDRKDGKDYWTTDNLYTEADLIELLEAFALSNVAKQGEQLCEHKGFQSAMCEVDYCPDCDTYIPS